MKISVFINTLNEAQRLRDCLESVKWADEIVVVDMHSDDATTTIAREYTDKIFTFKRMGYCEPARKFAAAKTTGDWILNLDADEVMTLGLKRELLRIAAEGNFDAVCMPRKNFFWGREMRFAGCGLMQDRPLRFYKRDAVVFTDIIHAGIQLNSGARVCKISDPQACLLHFSYTSLGQYWEKMDRYSMIEAKQLFDAGKDYPLKAALKDAWAAFWKRYFKKGQGRQDGALGFFYCVSTAVYKLNVFAHHRLMKAHTVADYLPKITQEYETITRAALKELADNKE